jgi:hypothetical protein
MAPPAPLFDAHRVRLATGVSCNIRAIAAENQGFSRYLADNSGVSTVVDGASEDAGQRLFSLVDRWWPGPGSNRRPSAFQADARTN